MSLKLINGYKFSGISAGIKKNGKLDLGLIYSEKDAICVASFTKSLLKSNSIIVSQKHLTVSHKVRAIIANSGCANTACGKDGIEVTEKICDNLAKELGVKKEEVIIASTGIIGEPLPFEKIVRSLELGVWSLANNEKSAVRFAKSIMTTDTKYKLVVKNVNVGNKKGTIMGIAKGAGMIAPNLEIYKSHATMLVFLLTDIMFEYNTMQELMNDVVLPNFNSFSIDGDTSPNDTIFFVSNGAIGNSKIDVENLRNIKTTLNEVCKEIILKLLFDGEGVTKVVKLIIKNCEHKEAEIIAKTVANSLLVKTAINGADPNWGRILAACGRSGVNFDINKLSIWIGKHQVVKNGNNNFVKDSVIRKVMLKNFYEITIDISKQNTTPFIYYTTDLSKKYVDINSKYKT